MREKSFKHDMRSCGPASAVVPENDEIFIRWETADSPIEKIAEGFP